MSWFQVSWQLLLGFLLAVAGGNFFVRGILGGSAWLRLAPALVAVTLAAFATSAPELAVGVLSAAEGKPDLSFGNALGGSVINLGLVLGLAAVLGGLHGGGLRRGKTFPFALAAWPILLAVGWDGTIGRVDGVGLLAAFALWLASVVYSALRDAREAREHSGEDGPRTSWKPVLPLIGGAVFLGLAAELIVRGAGGAAERLGVSPLLIGATLISLGTTVPELVTTLVARGKGHADVGFGTVVGSTLMNLVLVVPIVALLHPVPVSRGVLLPACGFGLVMTLLVLPRGADGGVGRRRGALLILLYILFIAWAGLDMARGGG